MYPLMPGTIIGDWQYASTADIASTDTVEVKAAHGSDKRNYVTGVQVTNSHATQGTLVQILSGSTVIANLYVGPQIAATGSTNGYGVTFMQPLKGGVNEAINVDCAAGAAVRVSLQGFIAIG